MNTSELTAKLNSFDYISLIRNSKEKRIYFSPEIQIDQVQKVFSLLWQCKVHVQFYGKNHPEQAKKKYRYDYFRSKKQEREGFWSLQVIKTGGSWGEYLINQQILCLQVFQLIKNASDFSIRLSPDKLYSHHGIRSEEANSQMEIEIKQIHEFD